jgi:NADPH:quinone reductase-like Zn-dependent oxidoreductase
VVNTSDKDYQKQLGMICMKLKPEACLECVSGQTTGEMLDYMSFGSTLILYGLLSDQPAGNIRTIGFIGKSQTIESFLLTNFLFKKSLTEYIDFILRAEPLFTTDLTSVIQKRYGFDQIDEAIEYYLKNQTNGKIILKSDLTGKGALAKL